jgi:hypothetical protein
VRKITRETGRERERERYRQRKRESELIIKIHGNAQQVISDKIISNAK